MRNLKKILALVLALVMSLSLMATAGAADFSDKDQISDKYSDAVTVLNGLEVFKGYDNGARFEPQGDITRAEVAAIIYRIATGDVSDTQKDIYSTWGLFTDVADGSWYAGYVNYCANAGYIKGRGNKIFDPNGKVTGYEALAMILRAIGYDKNNEFSGSNWQVNTASIAKQRGITNNITDTLLGQAATREVVAEILFQAILVPTVTFNTATISYTNNATSLGKDVLNLDKVTGVVVANEYANVQDDDLKVLAEGKTQLRVAAGDVRTLDLGTDLNDVGMSENAYIQGSKVLLISEADNTVYDNTDKKGEHVDIGSASKFSSVSGMSKNDSTEFFVNFDHATRHEANRRIELKVTFRDADAEAEFQRYADGIDISKVAADNGYTVYVNNVVLPLNSALDYAELAGYSYAGGATITYEKVFRVDEEVKDNDLSILRGIFGMADDDEYTKYGVNGSVYVGTNSKDVTNIYGYYAGDKSNEMSFKSFKDEYINDTVDKKWDTSNDGEWVKIIDNNGDGVADYAFKTTFTLDKAVDTYTSGDNSTLRYYSLDLINNKDNVEQVKYLNTVAEGDIVLHTTIDKQALVWKANSAEDTVTKINDIYKRSITATTSSGDVYNQSEIGNATRLDQRIELMSENVNYRMYLDAFGRIRAYEPVDGNQYALITEMYYGNYRNNRYVLNDILTAEMKAGDEGLTERVVNNPYNNNFLLSISNLLPGGRNNWADLNDKMEALRTSGLAADYERDLYQNIVDRVNWGDTVYNTQATDWAKNVVLQPATAHLGFNTQSTLAEGIFRNATTNIARYVVNADGTVTLSTAAQQNYNANGSLAAGFAIDYVQLTNSSVRKGQNVFTGVVESGFNANVDAVNETEFYIVSDSGVEHFVGFSNLPAVSDIRAMYAVARNTTRDNVRQNYWVADVIVIESDTYSAQPDDYLLVLGRADYNGNVALSNSRQAVGTQNILAISAKQGGAIRILPTSYNWGTNTVTPGVYKAYGVAEQENGVYSVANLKRVTPRNVNNALDPQSVNTSAFNLRVGTVTKVIALNNRVEVEYAGVGVNTVRQINLQGQALGVTQANNGYITVGDRMNGDWSSNLVTVGHQIIWVEDSSANALFTIDLTYSEANSQLKTGIIQTLKDIYNDVAWAQANRVDAGDHRVRITYTDSSNHGTAFVEDRLVNNETEVRINKAPAGYSLTGMPTVYAYNDVNHTTPLTSGNGYYAIANDTDNGYGIRRVTTDLRIVVPVTAETYKVSMGAGIDTWANTATATSQCPKDNNSKPYTLGTQSVHAGDTITVTLSGATALNLGNYSLKATWNNGTELTVTKTNVGNNTATFSFTMPAGSVTLTPSYSAPSSDVIWKNTIGVNYSTTDKNIQGETFTFTATAQKGYKLNGITASRNGIVRSLTGNGDNTYTVRDDVTGAGLTITFDATPVKGNLKVMAKDNNGVAPSISTTQGAVTISSPVIFTNTSYASAIVITVNDNWSNLEIKAVGCDVSTSANTTNNVTTLQVNVWDANAELTIGLKSSTTTTNP